MSEERISSPFIKDPPVVCGGTAALAVRGRERMNLAYNVDCPVEAVGFTQHPQVAFAADPLPVIRREVGHAADVGELQSGFGELLREEGVGYDQLVVSVGFDHRFAGLGVPHLGGAVQNRHRSSRERADSPGPPVDDRDVPGITVVDLRPLGGPILRAGGVSVAYIVEDQHTAGSKGCRQRLDELCVPLDVGDVPQAVPAQEGELHTVARQESPTKRTSPW